MIKYAGQNATQDKRGIFTRFLDPLMRSAMGLSTPHGAIISSIQKTLEDITDSVSDTSSKAMKLSTAENDYLDLWGDRVGVIRKSGEDDESYRARITKYVTVTRVTKPALEDALRDYLGDDSAYVNIYEPYSNIFYLNRSLLNGDDRLQGNYYRYAVIEVTIDRDFNRSEVLELLGKFKANGVMVYLSYNPSTNKDATLLDDLFLHHRVEDTAYVSDYFSGFSMSNNKMITPSTGRVIPPRGDVFRTNKSRINGVDVLSGGNLAGGIVSPHAMFYSSDEFIPGSNSTPVEMGRLPGNDPLAPMDYTTLSFVGGSSVKMELFEYRPFNIVYDLKDFYQKLSFVSFADRAMKYVRIDVHNSKRGLDIGEIEVRNVAKQVVSNGANVFHYDPYTGLFKRFPNGSNIVNSLERNSTLILELPSATPLSDIKLQTVLSEATVTVSVSEDNEEYYSVYHGELTDGQRYRVVDHNTTDSELTTLLSSTLRNPIFQGVFTNYELTKINMEAYNFSTKAWEPFSNIIPRRVNNVVAPVSEEGLQNFLNDQGALAIRVIPTSNKATVNMNFVGLALTEGVVLRENLSLDIELFSLGVQREGTLSVLDYQVKQEQLITNMGTYPLKRLRFFVEPVDEEDKVEYFTLTEGMQHNDPRGFSKGVFFSGITGEGVYQITLPDGTSENGSLDISGSVGYINLGEWRDDITELAVSFKNYIITGVDIEDYKTGEWKTQEIGEGYKIFRKVPKPGFSFDNPYGDGTDLTLMVNDFFTTTYSFSERQLDFDSWVTGLHEELAIAEELGQLAHFTGYSNFQNSVLTAVTGKVYNNVNGVFKTNNSPISSLSVLAGGLTSSGTPSNHALFTSSKTYQPPSASTALDMTTASGNVNLPPAEYGVLSTLDSRSVDFDLKTTDALYMGYNLMDYAESFGSRALDPTQLSKVTLVVKDVSKGVNLSAIVLYANDGTAVPVSKFEYIDAYSGQRSKLTSNSINRPTSRGGYLVCTLTNVSEVSQVGFKATKPTGTLTVLGQGVNTQDHVLVTYPIAANTKYSIATRLDDRATLPNRLLAYARTGDVVTNGVAKYGAEVSVEIWNFKTLKWVTLPKEHTKTINLVARLPLTLSNFNDFVNPQGTMVTRLVPISNDGRVTLSFLGTNFRVLEELTDGLNISCEVDSEVTTLPII